MRCTVSVPSFPVMVWMRNVLHSLMNFITLSPGGSTFGEGYERLETLRNGAFPTGNMSLQMGFEVLYLGLTSYCLFCLLCAFKMWAPCLLTSGPISHSFLLCLPCHNGLYPPGILSQVNPVLPSVAFGQSVLVTAAEWNPNPCCIPMSWSLGFC